MNHVVVARGVQDDDHYDAIMTIESQIDSIDAARFANELQHMYTRYAERHHWQMVVQSATSHSSVSEPQVTQLLVVGAGAYARLKHEGGTHRVQRVPSGEVGGRIHTATVKVVVLPAATEAAQQAALHAGDWAEKIRTYHFPRNRVTDHRINLSVYDLAAVLDGAIDTFIDALRHH